MTSGLDRRSWDTCIIQTPFLCRTYVEASKLGIGTARKLTWPCRLAQFHLVFSSRPTSRILHRQLVRKDRACRLCVVSRDRLGSRRQDQPNETYPAYFDPLRRLVQPLTLP